LFEIPKPILSVPWVLIVPGCSLKIFNSSRSKPRANYVFDHQPSLCNLQYHHVPLSFVPAGTMRRTALLLCRSVARQMGSSIVHISQTCVGVYHLGGNQTISTVQ
ncbi:hypothetical protein H4582DRAFT_2040207, partial [Lactarius indigo]